MSQVFEDEFMDLQTALISLCLEVTKKKSIKYMYIVLMKKRVKCLMLYSM